MLATPAIGGYGGILCIHYKNHKIYYFCILSLIINTSVYAFIVPKNLSCKKGSAEPADLRDTHEFNELLYAPKICYL